MINYDIDIKSKKNSYGHVIITLTIYYQDTQNYFKIDFSKTKDLFLSGYIFLPEKLKSSLIEDDFIRVYSKDIPFKANNNDFKLTNKAILMAF